MGLELVLNAVAPSAVLALTSKLGSWLEFRLHMECTIVFQSFSENRLRYCVSYTAVAFYGVHILTAKKKQATSVETYCMV